VLLRDLWEPLQKPASVSEIPTYAGRYLERPLASYERGRWRFASSNINDA
jgi:hypothetical protein